MGCFNGLQTKANVNGRYRRFTVPVAKGCEYILMLKKKQSALYGGPTGAKMPKGSTMSSSFKLFLHRFGTQGDAHV